MWPSVTDITSGPLMEYCPRPSYIWGKRHCPCRNSSSDATFLAAGHTRSTRRSHWEMQRREWLGTYKAPLCFVQAMKTTCFRILRAKKDGWYWTQQLNKAPKNEDIPLFINGGYA